MQVVIFIGIQGAGKSTFYRKHFSDTHVRINLDMLKTRHRELTLFEACLACGQHMVIDNTNPTLADRARYIEFAISAGAEVIGYYFSSRISDAIQRNTDRESSKRVPDKAIFGTAKRLEQPKRSEGFNALYYVTCSGADEFSVEDWNDAI